LASRSLKPRSHFFGSKVHKRLRSRHALKTARTELASLSGMQQNTIPAIENGNEVYKLDTLIGVIAVLDLQIVPRQQDSAANCPTVENCQILGAAHSLSASFPRSFLFRLNTTR
jgi:DNA-binding XRE family transcriptional regulator